MMTPTVGAAVASGMVSPTVSAGLRVSRLTVGRPLRLAPHRFIQLRRRCCAAISSDKKVASVKVSEFEDVVLKSDVPVLVDFWAEWCGPCKLVAPLMDWAAQQYEGQLQVVKVEADENKALLERYNIYGLPALLIFKDGQEVPGSRKEGAISRKKLEAMLDEFLPRSLGT